MSEVYNEVNRMTRSENFSNLHKYLEANPLRKLDGIVIGTILTIKIISILCR